MFYRRIWLLPTPCGLPVTLSLAMIVKKEEDKGTYLSFDRVKTVGMEGDAADEEGMELERREINDEEK